MNSPSPEPEGGKETTLQILDTAGNPWIVPLMHNGEKIPLDRLGKARFHMNGGPVKVNGIEVQRKIQRGVTNILQYDSWNGSFRSIGSD